MLLLSGPTAAGKNTVAQQIARQRERCAIVDFDAVRAMFVHPHLAPWDGEAGAAQLLLGVEQVCGLAHGFARAGWDVIVLDVVMPGRNGFQACRDLKSDDRFKNIPIVLCTSKGQESDKFWGQQQGANGYVVKPGLFEHLVQFVHALSHYWVHWNRSPYMVETRC